jgi:hypothetical protein
MTLAGLGILAAGILGAARSAHVTIDESVFVNG